MKSELQLDFVNQAISGKIISRHQELFTEVDSDTRKQMTNSLFVALKGDSFDAHKFLSQAVDQGATGLIVHQETEELAKLKDRVTIILVKDTLIALQSLAHAVRFKNTAKIIGIAGSNGKTTSKEFTAALIGSFRKVHYSKGSFNNHWGVPFTLLAQPEDAEVAVVEMGMNHHKELAELAKIAQPDICVCTYVGVEHIEYFGTLEQIAQAESEIYDFSPATCLRIFNLDNVYTLKMYDDCKKKFPQAPTLTFSADKKADVQIQIRSSTMEEILVEGTIAGVKGQARVPVFGRHNITNLMVAASAALAVGLTPEQIWSGLTACRTNWGRNQLVQTKSGALILFDGYNSNPDSMKALIDNLRLIQGYNRKIAVFAEMRELGDLAPTLHRETGQFVGGGNLDEIWFYGPHHNEFAEGVKAAGFKGKMRSTADYDEKISAELGQSLKKGDVALVKGSRGMRLERFVHRSDALDFDEKS